MAATDDTEARVVEHVRATLAKLEGAGGSRLFARVEVTDDPDTFLRTADTGGNAVAGVAQRPSERRPGTDNSELWVARLPLEVVVKVPAQTEGTDAHGRTVARLSELAAAVRDGLTVDRSRGGLARLVEFGGEIINGTDVDGSGRNESRLWRTNFGSVSVPVTIGLAKLRN